jgi:hypothetical protein
MSKDLILIVVFMLQNIDDKILAFDDNEMMLPMRLFGAF